MAEWNTASGGFGDGQSAMSTQAVAHSGWSEDEEDAAPAPNYGGFSNPMYGGFSNPMQFDRSSCEKEKEQKRVNQSSQLEAWDVQTPRDLEEEKSLFGRAMSSGINFENYDEIPVKATGGGDSVPPPIEKFSDLHLHKFLTDNVIDLCRYDKPTPIQKYALPSVLDDRDVMGCAETGSGKTAAFLLPVMHYILTNGKNVYRKPEFSLSGRTKVYPLALVMAPTRELSMQIYAEAKKFAYRTCIKPRVMYGGRENYNTQLSALKRGCHVLIGTPGRLIDILEHAYVSLECCKYLILDEADRMLDMGFEPQIIEIVQGHDLPSKERRHTMMFSATFPQAIQKLAQEYLKADYIFIAVGRVGSTSANIRQEVRFADSTTMKNEILTDFLEERKKEKSLTLIFVETKRYCQTLTMVLRAKGFNCGCIHGDLEQVDRERQLAEFRAGRSTILIGTGVVGRGLDIPNVNHVVIYDMPGDFGEYVHRIGRTGRAGNIGYATVFVSRDDKLQCRKLVTLLRECNQHVPELLEEYASEADEQMARLSGMAANMAASSFGGHDVRRGGVGACHKCGVEGHFARECRLGRRDRREVSPQKGSYYAASLGRTDGSGTAANFGSLSDGRNFGENGANSPLDEFFGGGAGRCDSQPTSFGGCAGIGRGRAPSSGLSPTLQQYSGAGIGRGRPAHGSGFGGDVGERGSVDRYASSGENEGVDWWSTG